MKAYTMSPSQTPASRLLAVANAVPIGSDVLYEDARHAHFSASQRTFSLMLSRHKLQVSPDDITSVRGTDNRLTAD
jgi:hypothetical protein